MKNVWTVVEANKATPSYAASAASANQEDQNLAAGSGWDSHPRGTPNQQQMARYGQGTQGAGGYPSNQRQGAQYDDRRQQGSGLITPDMSQERYEDTLKWVERVTGVNREQPRVYGLARCGLNRIYGISKDGEREIMQFE